MGRVGNAGRYAAVGSVVDCAGVSIVSKVIGTVLYERLLDGSQLRQESVGVLLDRLGKVAGKENGVGKPLTILVLILKHSEQRHVPLRQSPKREIQLRHQQKNWLQVSCSPRYS